MVDDLSMDDCRAVVSSAETARNTSSHLSKSRCLPVPFCIGIQDLLRVGLPVQVVQAQPRQSIPSRPCRCKPSCRPVALQRKKVNLTAATLCGCCAGREAGLVSSFGCNLGFDRSLLRPLLSVAVPDDSYCSGNTVITALHRALHDTVSAMQSAAPPVLCKNSVVWPGFACNAVEQNPCHWLH